MLRQRLYLVEFAANPGLDVGRYYAISTPSLCALFRSDAAAESVPSPVGVPGESNAFQPANLPAQRERGMSTVAVPLPPLPV
ncbi:hypothetical protein BDV93DRAFT_555757 [Ceratobasidium sp. AG-I]|nr:hypothetical protein BDV93DRAFT_555757 [Ceratobasidium sp. AG-I]